MRAYLLGDSHTGALGPRLKQLLPGLTFESFSGYSTARAKNARNFGIGGQDLIIVSLGGNDFGDQSNARSSLLYDLMRNSPEAKILWVGPFHSTNQEVDSRHLKQTESQQAQFKSLKSVYFLDGRPISHALQHSPDGTHFTGTSYSVIAREIANRVASLPSSTDTVAKAGTGAAIAIVVGIGAWLLLRKKAA